MLLFKGVQDPDFSLGASILSEAASSTKQIVQESLKFTTMSHSKFHERLHVQCGNLTPNALYKLVSWTAESGLNFLCK